MYYYSKKIIAEDPIANAQARIDKPEVNCWHSLTESECISNELTDASLDLLKPLLTSKPQTGIFCVGSTQAFYAAAWGNPSFVLLMDRNSKVIRSSLLYKSLLINLANVVEVQRFKPYYEANNSAIFDDLRNALWTKLSPEEKKLFLTNPRKKYKNKEPDLTNNITDEEIRNLYQNYSLTLAQPDTYLTDQTKLDRLFKLFADQRFVIVHQNILSASAEQLMRKYAAEQKQFSFIYVSNILDGDWLRKEETILFDRFIGSMPKCPTASLIASYDSSATERKAIETSGLDHISSTSTSWTYTIKPLPNTVQPQPYIRDH